MIWMVAAALAEDPAFDCSKPEMLPQQGMNLCAAQEWQQADKQLNDVYAALKAKLTGDSATKLRDAQRAWITFRDAECAWQGDAMAGGSAEPLLIYSCMANLTEQRVKSLKDDLAQREAM